jgi:hypothetical protein
VVELLLPGTGSATGAPDTLALFITVPLAVGLTANVPVNVVLADGARLGIVHGNPVKHGAVADTNVRPVPGVSVTVIEALAEGPLLITMNV